MKTLLVTLSSLFCLSAMAELPNYKCFFYGKEVLNFTFESDLQNVNSPSFAKKEVERILRSKNPYCQGLEVKGLSRASYEEVEVQSSCGNDGMPTFPITETLNCVETYLN